MRALKSPAINDLASVLKVFLKLSLNPLTPTSAATPTATDSTTNPNLPGADFRSRQPIAAARSQLNARLAIALLAQMSILAKIERRAQPCPAWNPQQHGRP